MSDETTITWDEYLRDLSRWVQSVMGDAQTDEPAPAHPPEEVEMSAEQAVSARDLWDQMIRASAALKQQQQDTGQQISKLRSLPAAVQEQAPEARYLDRSA